MSNYIALNINDKRYLFTHSAVTDAIEQLKNEMMRLVNLNTTERKNFEKLSSIGDQINYLEELLTAYERDEKKLL